VHAPPRVGEEIGGDEPVRSRADDDRVDVGHAFTVPAGPGA
jgi:hypothetical protein